MSGAARTRRRRPHGQRDGDRRADDHGDERERGREGAEVRQGATEEQRHSAQRTDDRDERPGTSWPGQRHQARWQHPERQRNPGRRVDGGGNGSGHGVDETAGSIRPRPAHRRLVRGAGVAFVTGPAATGGPCPSVAQPGDFAVHPSGAGRRGHGCGTGPAPAQGHSGEHLVPGQVTALAGEVRGDDGDLGRGPRRTGIRVEHPHPSRGVGRPAEPGQRHVRVEGPALGRRRHRAGGTHRPGQRRERVPPDSPANSTRARDTSGKHPPPSSASPTGAARPAATRHAGDDVLDHPVRRRPHERQRQVPLLRGRPAQPAVGIRLTSRNSSRSATAGVGGSRDTNSRMGPSSAAPSRCQEAHLRRSLG